MAGKTKDPTAAIRLKARRYPQVDEGTACTQSSFKAGKTAFLYIGAQGGRYKAMFKLRASMPEAVGLAGKQPDRFETGSTAWVTARFTTEEPMPSALWRKWLDESYALSVGSQAGGRSGATKCAGKASTKKKTSKKSAAKKKATSKKAVSRKKKSGRASGR
jgi:hypothetical protein